MDLDNQELEERRRTIFDRRFFERRMWKIDFRPALKKRLVGDTRIMDRRSGSERRAD